MKWKFSQQATDPTNLDLHIYDDIQGDSWSWWDGRIKSETSANHFREELSKHPNVKTINVFINSMGGDVYEAYGICSQLERSTAEIIVHVDGFAASAASLLLCIADKVIMTSQSMVMIHNMMTYMFGNANELRKVADDLDKMMEGNRTLYLKRMNITEEELIEMLDKETYLTAKDCVQYGLCDVIEGETNVEAALQIAQFKENRLRMKVAQFKQIQQIMSEIATDGKGLKEPPKQDSTMLSFFSQFKN